MLLFDDDTWFQERQQVKDNQSYVPISPYYPTCPSTKWEHQSRYDNSIPWKALG